MSLKRSTGGGGRSHFGGGADPGAKVDRQALYDELKKLSDANQVFAPVDIALTIGAGEPQVSRSLLGLAAEGYLEKIDAGRYRVIGLADVPQAEFLKALARATKIDSTRQRDLSEIGRLKQNNDIMRGRLLQMVAERDFYLAALKQRGIDPGPPPAPPSPAGPPPSGNVALPGQSESSTLPSGPGAAVPAPIAPSDTMPTSSSSEDDGGS